MLERAPTQLAAWLCMDRDRHTAMPGPRLEKHRLYLADADTTQITRQQPTACALGSAHVMPWCRVSVAVGLTRARIHPTRILTKHLRNQPPPASRQRRRYATRFARRIASSRLAPLLPHRACQCRQRPFNLPATKQASPTRSPGHERHRLHRHKPGFFSCDLKHRNSP